MAEYLIQDTTLEAIADSIRNKTNTTAKIKVEDMATKISSIKSSYSLESKTVTPARNKQIIEAGSGYDGLSEVVVAGDDDLIASNIKSGVTIFGVTGTYAGSSVNHNTCTVTVSGSNAIYCSYYIPSIPNGNYSVETGSLDGSTTQFSNVPAGSVIEFTDGYFISPSVDNGRILASGGGGSAANGYVYIKIDPSATAVQVDLN